jgi:hypothetical protein
MAHFKRKRPRTSSGNHNRPHWLNDPAWWDIMMHRRPHRRKDKNVADKIKRGLDPDEALWAIARKPHKYYW